MKEVFVKKHWDEESVTFYLHFQEGVAVRQIEISSTGTKYLSIENPEEDESILYDQSLEQLSLEETDFISQQDFEIVWNRNMSL